MGINMGKIERGIVITTHQSTKPFLIDLIDSLSGVKYPYIIIDHTNKQNEFEIGGIRIGKDIFNEFIYLHDTVYIKNIDVFDMLFEQQASVSPNRNMYLGYYNSDVLEGMDIPVVSNKRDAVTQESLFMEYYMRESFNHGHLFDEFVDGEVYEYKHGRENKVIENEYLKKYKGTWAPHMVPKQ
jgi:hypothetical protein